MLRLCVRAVFCAVLGVVGVVWCSGAFGVERDAGEVELRTEQPPVGLVPLELNFLASGDPGDGWSWFFDFGDGSPVVESGSGEVAHTYLVEGDFEVGLVVRDADGVVVAEPSPLLVSARSATADRTLSLALWGSGLSYSQDGVDIGGSDLEVVRQGFAITSIRGTAAIPPLSGDGDASATFRVRRLSAWVPLYLGRVIVEDAGAGVNQSTPMILGNVDASGNGASGSATWFRPVSWSFLPKQYRLSFTIVDESVGPPEITVEMDPVCLRDACIYGDNAKGGPTFTYTYDPSAGTGSPTYSSRLVGYVLIDGGRVDVDGVIDDYGAQVDATADLSEFGLLEYPVDGVVNVRGNLYWGSKLSEVTVVVPPDSVAESPWSGNFVVSSSANARIEVGSGFDADAIFEIGRVRGTDWVSVAGTLETTSGESSDSVSLSLSGDVWYVAGQGTNYSIEGFGDVAVGEVMITGVEAMIDPSGMTVTVAELDVESIDLKATGLSGTLSYSDGEIVSTVSAADIDLGVNGNIVTGATITVGTSGLAVTDGNFTYTSAVPEGGDPDIDVSLEFAGSIVFVDGDAIYVSLMASDATAEFYGFPVRIGSAMLDVEVGAVDTTIVLGVAELDVAGVTGSLDGSLVLAYGGDAGVNLTGNVTAVVDGITIMIPNFDLNARSVTVDVFVPVREDPNISDPRCGQLDSDFICMSGTMSYDSDAGVLMAQLEADLPEFQWNALNFEQSKMVLDTSTSQSGIEISSMSLDFGATYWMPFSGVSNIWDRAWTSPPVDYLGQKSSLEECQSAVSAANALPDIKYWSFTYYDATYPNEDLNSRCWGITDKSWDETRNDDPNGAFSGLLNYISIDGEFGGSITFDAENQKLAIEVHAKQDPPLEVHYMGGNGVSLDASSSATLTLNGELGTAQTTSLNKYSDWNNVYGRTDGSDPDSVLLGTASSLEECQDMLTERDSASGPFESYTYFTNDYETPSLRKQCWGTKSTRWQPYSDENTFSGRKSTFQIELSDASAQLAFLDIPLAGHIGFNSNGELVDALLTATMGCNNEQPPDCQTLPGGMPGYIIFTLDQYQLDITGNLEVVGREIAFEVPVPFNDPATYPTTNEITATTTTTGEDNCIAGHVAVDGSDEIGFCISLTGDQTISVTDSEISLHGTIQAQLDLLSEPVTLPIEAVISIDAIRGMVHKKEQGQECNSVEILELKPFGIEIPTQFPALCLTNYELKLGVVYSNGLLTFTGELGIDPWGMDSVFCTISPGGCVAMKAGAISTTVELETPSVTVIRKGEFPPGCGVVVIFPCIPEVVIPGIPIKLDAHAPPDTVLYADLGYDQNGNPLPWFELPPPFDLPAPAAIWPGVRLDSACGPTLTMSSLGLGWATDLMQEVPFGLLPTKWDFPGGYLKFSNNFEEVQACFTALADLPIPLVFDPLTLLKFVRLF